MRGARLRLRCCLLRPKFLLRLVCALVGVLVCVGLCFSFWRRLRLRLWPLRRRRLWLFRARLRSLRRRPRSLGPRQEVSQSHRGAYVCIRLSKCKAYFVIFFVVKLATAGDRRRRGGRGAILFVVCSVTYCQSTVSFHKPNIINTRRKRADRNQSL